MNSRVNIHKRLRGIGSSIKEWVFNICYGHSYTAFGSRNSAEVEGALLHDARAILARHTYISQSIG